ncbi:hypothetical protein KIN20_030312 [Parelaphostrongylus tenuis]|uniref:Uncharacterized protein n=1 Tax=Parelaphostrongylus tenuis TaxID=148309 RepID=A0AAD5WGD3_PARTN|nr:hypothetical protein KIN20_030312 [Parelaphostrongylus tenuis]
MYLTTVLAVVRCYNYTAIIEVRRHRRDAMKAAIGEDTRDESCSEFVEKSKMEAVVLQAFSYRRYHKNKSEISKYDSCGMVSSTISDLFTHCALLAYSAPEGKVILPEWCGTDRFDVLVRDVKPEGAACVLDPKVVQFCFPSTTIEKTLPALTQFRSGQRLSQHVRLFPEMRCDTQRNSLGYYIYPRKETYPDDIQKVDERIPNNSIMPAQILYERSSKKMRMSLDATSSMSKAVVNLSQRSNSETKIECQTSEMNTDLLNQPTSMFETIGKSMSMSIYY